MFGCGIGRLGKRLKLRRLRSSNTRKSAGFDAFDTEKLDCASSCCSDRQPEEEDVAWMPEVPPSIRKSIKHSLSQKGDALPITVNPNDVWFGTTLGRGVSGTVYRGRLGCEEVAVKIIRPQENVFELRTEPLELYMGQSVGHPNLVKVLGVYVGGNDQEREASVERTLDEDMSIYESPPGVRRTSSSLFSDIAQDLSEGPEEIWILMEYCNRGSLRDAIKRGEFFEDTERQRPRILHILFAALEVAAALEHLHSFGIIHGDLKSQNVMLTTSQILAKNFVCKVGDFGMSRPLTQIKTHISTFTAGTVSHTAPEVLRDGILTPSVDVFSFGMLLWELMAGELPFIGLNSGEIMVSIVEGQRPEIPEYCPSMYADLIKRCWSQKRDERPSFKEVTAMLKTMLGGPPAAENKGIPALQSTDINSSGPTTSSSEMLLTGDTAAPSSYTTTGNLSENGGCYLSPMRIQPLKARSEVEREPEEKTKKDSETQLHSDSMIPKPPRISVTNHVTDEENAHQPELKSRQQRRPKSFPQWEAYLNAINASASSSPSNNSLLPKRETKIPMSSSSHPATPASSRPSMR